MKIRFNLLAKGTRTDWVEVPARLDDRGAGTAKVKLQELPRDRFDELDLALKSAARLDSDLRLAYLQEQEAARKLSPLERVEASRQIDATYGPKLLASIEAFRRAEEEILRACVVDHAPESFRVEDLAGLDPGEVRAMLGELGFPEASIDAALSTGGALVPFEADDQGPGASLGTVTFYRRCQGLGLFSGILLDAIRRFVACEPVDAETLWAEYEKKHPKTGDDPKAGEGGDDRP